MLKIKVCKHLTKTLAMQKIWGDMQRAREQKNAQKIFNKNAKF